MQDESGREGSEWMEVREVISGEEWKECPGMAEGVENCKEGGGM